MWDWLYDLIDDAIGPIRKVVGEVTSRLTSIYALFTNTFSRWRNKADGWVRGLTALMPATLRQGIAVFTLLRYLLLVYVPNVAAQKAGEILGWVLDRVAEVRAFLLGQLGELRDWAWARVQEAIAFVGRVVEWAQTQFGEILTDLRATMRHVFGPLASPERLVAWILGALIAALVTWMLDNVDTLAYEAFRRRRGLEDQALVVAGRVVDRFM